MLRLQEPWRKKCVPNNMIVDDFSISFSHRHIFSIFFNDMSQWFDILIR